LAMQTPLNLALLTNLIFSAQKMQIPTTTSPDLFKHNLGLNQPQCISTPSPQIVPINTDAKTQKDQTINSNRATDSLYLVSPSGAQSERGNQLQINNVTVGSLMTTSRTVTKMGKQFQEIDKNRSNLSTISPTVGKSQSETGNKNMKLPKTVSCKRKGIEKSIPSIDKDGVKQVDDNLLCKQSHLDGHNDAGKGHSQEDEDAGRTLFEFLRELQKNHSKAMSEDRSQRGITEEMSTFKDSSFGNTNSHRETNLIPSSHPKAVDKMPRRKQRLKKPMDRSDISVVTASINDSVTSRGSISPKNLGKSLTHPHPHQVQDFDTSSTQSTAISKISDISRGGNESSSYGSNMEQNCSEESDCSKSQFGSSEGTTDKECPTKGPVRKRFKRSTFTSRNVEDHNNRMEALRNDTPPFQQF